jgi:copper chaperone CopZ
MDRRRFISHVSVAAGGGAVLDAATAPEDAKSVTYRISGFTCVTCAVGLEVMLRSQKGVTRANASYRERKVAIGFDGKLTSESALKAFIAQCGFSVIDGRV